MAGTYLDEFGVSKRGLEAISQGLYPSDKYAEMFGLKKGMLDKLGKGEWHHVERGGKVVERYFYSVDELKDVLDKYPEISFGKLSDAQIANRRAAMFGGWEHWKSASPKAIEPKPLEYDVIADEKHIEKWRKIRNKSKSQADSIAANLEMQKGYKHVLKNWDDIGSVRILDLLKTAGKMGAGAIAGKVAMSLLMPDIIDAPMALTDFLRYLNEHGYLEPNRPVKTEREIPTNLQKQGMSFKDFNERLGRGVLHD